MPGPGEEYESISIVIRIQAQNRTIRLVATATSKDGHPLTFAALTNGLRTCSLQETGIQTGLIASGTPRPRRIAASQM